MEENKDNRPNEGNKPTEAQRAAAKAQILTDVSNWLDHRIDEVFEMADRDDMDKPRITWGDLTEISEQICGCVADDLHYDLGDVVQDDLEQQMSELVAAGEDVGPANEGE